MESEYKSLLFIDVDTVISCNKRKRIITGSCLRDEYIKYNRIRSWEQEKFRLLTDNEVFELDSWDNSLCERLARLGRKDTLFVLFSKKNILKQHFDIIAGFRWLSNSALLSYSKEGELLCGIKKYVDQLEEKNRYLVISSIDLNEYFTGHFYMIGARGKIDYHELQAKANMILYAKKEDYFSWNVNSSISEEPVSCRFFYKVIFLDIDGVLNDEGDHYSKGVIIDSDMMRNLTYIVDNTNAAIILSSSWKYAYKRFADNDYQSQDQHLHMLQDALDEYGLSISGTTPFSNESGPEARPLEIREWLWRFNNIFSYVILDDDTFWEWGWLQRNVVTTQTYAPDGAGYRKYTRGLTYKLAKKAIRILNDAGARMEYI